ncbi:protein kinase [Pannus brasiliensis CCIBt3594]|uniref:non-specific serine/threonine protein kinase n=1 Tax=Pannus brasiliensis CCIBt3594 TaxID=1427578 RepID=A0AAW9QP22_9CHRO
MPAEQRSGNVINQQYQILRVLGKGGIGTTYEARNLADDTTVALKAISLRQLKDPKQLDLLEREVEILQKLDRPGIPRYLDYFEVDGEGDRIFYLVQELAPGKNLDRWVKEGWRATETELKNIARQVLEILDYLHGFTPPIIHRDIKPHNLVRSPEGKIFLVDFGAVQNAYYSTLAGGRTTVGTFGYMPLEQAGGQAVPASDLYSLGATLVFLLTHRSPGELSWDGLTLDFRSRISVSAGFADWLEKLLEPDVEERFASAREALTALRNPRSMDDKGLAKRRGLAWLGLGIFSLTGVLFFQNYKGGILTMLGFPQPYGMCSDRGVTWDYLSSGGRLSHHFISPAVKTAEYCLLWAIAERDRALVELIIDREINLDYLRQYRGNGEKDSHWTTPMLEAVRADSKELVELLISKGASVNLIPPTSENTFLFCLYNYPSHYNPEYTRFTSPLAEAISRGNKEIIHLLVSKGASVNIPHKNPVSLPPFNQQCNR